MLGADRLHQLAEQVIGVGRAMQTEVVIVASDEQLTRFANNEIHQHVAETNVEVRVRAVLGQQIGVAVTNDLSAAGLERAAQQATAVAQRQAPNPDFQTLPAPQPIRAVPDAWVDATAQCTPDQRAAGVGAIVRLAAQQGLVAAGAFSTAMQEIAVVNSLGVRAYHAGTSADLSTVVMGGDTSGWAAAASRDVVEIDPEVLGHEAVGKAIRSRDPQPLAAGTYPVVLEPYAVAEMLMYFNYLGAGALAQQEGRSPLELGAQQAAPLVTLYDDGYDVAGLPMPFDWEGVPKQRINIIENGVARAVVYDTQTAAKDGVQSTGHALPAPNTYGPLALNLHMQPGELSAADLIKGVERGVYVTRFWYVNVVQPKQAILTGMTRDGTFLIENGEIVGPVRNLRFTHSALDALRDVQAVGRETVLDRGYFGATRAPALQIGAFTFTSTTEF